jgi:hypothetical protein
MNKVTKHYVQFLSPGTFVGESWNEGITEQDPNAIAFPDRAYAFRMFVREDVIDRGETYTGKPTQVGPVYFHPESVVESLDQVRRNPMATKTLVSNMEGNGWSHIVWSRWGNWPQPWMPAEMVVLPRTAP